MMRLSFGILLSVAAIFGAEYEPGSVFVNRTGNAGSAHATNTIVVSGTNAAIKGSLTLDNVIATNGITSLGPSGAIKLLDSDGSHHMRIVANGTTTTDVNLIGPAAPFTGLAKFTASATTNAAISAAVDGVDYSVGKGFISFAATQINPTDNVTTYLGHFGSLAPQTTESRVMFQVPASGTITRWDLKIYTSGTAGTSETSTFSLRLNSATDFGPITISTDGTDKRGSATGLSQVVSAGDTISLKWVPPVNWVTEPTGVYVYGSAFIQ